MEVVKSPIYDSSKIRFRASNELQELIRYRFLISNLVSRDLKVRYKRSFLGFIWVMLNPLLTMSVMVYVFSQILKQSIPHFPTYSLGGLLLFNLFSQGTVAAMSNLTGSGTILRRIYVPPSAFVASSVGSALINMLYALVPFIAIAFYDGLRPHIGWALVLLPMFEMTVLTFGVGLIVASLMVYFRDVFEIYTVLITLLSFLTPLFYPASLLRQFPAAVTYNPLFTIIDSFRSIIIFNTLPSQHDLVYSAVFTFCTFVIGWFTFTRLEKNFAYNF